MHTLLMAYARFEYHSRLLGEGARLSSFRGDELPTGNEESVFLPLLRCLTARWLVQEHSVTVKALFQMSCDRTFRGFCITLCDR